MSDGAARAFVVVASMVLLAAIAALLARVLT